MFKLWSKLRYWLVGLLVLLLIIAGFILFSRPADFLAQRASDLIYYLVMQKRYLFDKYTDPNIYPKLATTENLDKALIALDVSTTTAVKINEDPIAVSTTSIPEVTKPLIASSTVKIGKTATTVPGLIIKDPNVVLLPLPAAISISAPNRPGTPTPILEYTNVERAKASLKPLVSDAALDLIAAARLDDLFINQYFEHESPDGKGVPALAQKEGYSYLLIGENLALGNFAGDQGIVRAWMDSPGHRANILNARYEELGVASRVGDYKGDRVTIAVQIFGEPISLCVQPNPNAQAVIASNVSLVTDAETEAKVVYDILREIEGDPDLDRGYYNQKVQEYNYFAKNINNAVAALKKMIETYNLQTNKYNTCISQ